MGPLTRQVKEFRAGVEKNKSRWILWRAGDGIHRASC